MPRKMVKTTLTVIKFDTLEGKFQNPHKDPKDLAKRMYAFCPDLVDQGVGSLEALAGELKKSRHLYFWWD